MNGRTVSDTAAGVAPRRWTWALLFVLAAVALACSNWGAIQAVNHETSDFAANTLLILDAKRLHLIYGNYSRVGFNHPGPAILYVLAFGELLFHDVLRLVPSPFSGQLLAVDLYNAAWLVLVVAMVRRMAGGLAPALLFGGVAVLAFAYCDHAILNGIWFPHLYVLPYAAMLVAIARLVHGRTDTLVPLAVSSGFLINGHASFVPMLGVILVVVVAANYLVTRRDPANRILGRAWFAAHRRALLVSAGILFLFFVPLIIATVKDFPGPIYQYLKFSRGNKGNTLREAARFTGVYWGLGHGAPARGALAWGGVLAALLLAGPRMLPAAFARDARALGIAFLGATLALLYYAKVGVDMLDQVYIALFYFAVPALAAGLLALVAYRALRADGTPKHAGALAPVLILALLAVAGSWHWLRQDPAYRYFYDNPQVVRLYEGVRALPGGGRIVLDLEQTPDNWSEVWGNTLALLAYAKRQGSDLACVNEHWHISFTRPLRCTPEEVAHNRRYDVRRTVAPDPVRGEPDLDVQGLSFFKAGAAPRPAAWVTVQAQPAYFQPLLAQGWAIEGEGARASGPVAVIALPADPARARRLVLDVGTAVPALEARLTVRARVDGKPAGEWALYASERRRRIALELGANAGTDAGAPHRIELRLERSAGHALDLWLYGVRKGPAQP
jgi:hypothetical protein